MKIGPGTRGYTIIEVMVFLIVSGVMFIIAAAFISGKQNKSEFRQAMNDINTKVQQTINDVSNGFYPSTGSFTCSAGSSGPITFNPGASSQGSNQNCVFLGKVMQFGVQSTNRTGYNIYTVAGRQYAGTSGITQPLAVSFSQSLPQVVYRAGVVDLTSGGAVEWGAKITLMKDLTSGTSLTGVGFFQSFPGYETASTLQSGSQNLSVIPIKGALDQSKSAMVSTIQNPLTGISDTNVQNNPNILICFDGQGGGYGTLTIGGNGGQRLSTAVQISSSHLAGCP